MKTKRGLKFTHVVRRCYHTLILHSIIQAQFTKAFLSFIKFGPFQDVINADMKYKPTKKNSSEFHFFFV